MFISTPSHAHPRMTLCLHLIVSQNLFFLVEQPSQSLLYMHRRFDYFINRVCWVSWQYAYIYHTRTVLANFLIIPATCLRCGCKVFFTRFWMLHHGADSSKRTVFWGNMRCMVDLNKGVLSNVERLAKTKAKTTRILAA